MLLTNFTGLLFTAQFAQKSTQRIICRWKRIQDVKLQLSVPNVWRKICQKIKYLWVVDSASRLTYLSPETSFAISASIMEFLIKYILIKHRKQLYQRKHTSLILKGLPYLPSNSNRILNLVFKDLKKKKTLRATGNKSKKRIINSGGLRILLPAFFAKIVSLISIQKIICPSVLASATTWFAMFALKIKSENPGTVKNAIKNQKLYLLSKTKSFGLLNRPLKKESYYNKKFLKTMKNKKYLLDTTDHQYLKLNHA